MDKPFKLDHLGDLPLYVQRDSFQTVCDDKSGYDHILLSTDSRTFFRFEWGDGFSLVTLFSSDGSFRRTFHGPLWVTLLLVNRHSLFPVRISMTGIQHNFGCPTPQLFAVSILYRNNLNRLA
jgi:hypothetical protein